MRLFDLAKKKKKPRIINDAGLSPSLGFTLVEALAVIAMIGVLASIVMVRVGVAKKQGKDTGVIAGLRETRNAAELYFDQLYTHEGVCDNADTTLSNQGNFGRIRSGLCC